MSLITIITRILDIVMQPISLILAFAYYFEGDVMRAIFWVLMLLWFGRGDVVRALRREIVQPVAPTEGGQ